MSRNRPTCKIDLVISQIQVQVVISQNRNFYITNVYRENTMFMSSDIRFIRRDQKTRRNGEACPSHSAFSGQAWYT